MPNTPAFGATTKTGGNGAFQGVQNAVGGFLGLNPTLNTVHGDYYDPLESSGQGMRSSIYGTLSGLWPGLANQSNILGGALGRAAALPGFTQGKDLASAEMQGNYLNGSPALDSAMGAMRSASAAQMANADARTRSQFVQNGMSFGTPMQEAQASGDAAATASANQAEAMARLQNYQSERQLQSGAINNYATATTTPINYLGQMNEAYLQPLTEISQIVRGLSTGGQVAQPDTVVDKGLFSNLTGAIGNL